MFQLKQSIGTPQIDNLLATYLAQLLQRFAERLRSVYLVGSAAEGTADSISDIDGLVIIRGVPSAADQQTFKSVTADWSLRSRSSMILDFVLVGDEDFVGRGALPKKTESWVSIYGEDIRYLIPPMTSEQYIDAIMRGSFVCLKHTRGTTGVLRYPLTYPDPDGEFFGYEQRGYREFDGWRSPGTKALVNGLSLAATTLVAIRTGFCATNRRESFAAYRERIGDQWASFLDEIHLRCRDEWAYRVPAAADERRRLHFLCRDVLQFENEYVLTCIEYLRSQMDAPDRTAAARAAETLGLISYDPGSLPESAPSTD